MAIVVLRIWRVEQNVDLVKYSIPKRQELIYKFWVLVGVRNGTYDRVRNVRKVRNCTGRRVVFITMLIEIPPLNLESAVRGSVDGNDPGGSGQYSRGTASIPLVAR